MPPAFRLDNKVEARKRKEKPFNVLPPKVEYSKGIKISNWEEYKESEPTDKDPHAERNYTLSHYNRLGIQPDVPFTTTSREMSKQIHDTKGPFAINPNKYLINYYSYSDDVGCLKYNLANMCPTICAFDYVTTSQHSFGNNTFCKMERVAYPIPPFLRYRKFAQEDPVLSENKFFDEGFYQTTKNLQQAKVSGWISYNPLTGTYNDGSLPEGRNAKCVPLNYDK